MVLNINITILGCKKTNDTVIYDLGIM